MPMHAYVVKYTYMQNPIYTVTLDTTSLQNCILFIQDVEFCVLTTPYFTYSMSKRNIVTFHTQRVGRESTTISQTGCRALR